MVINDITVLRVKHDVLYGVAKLVREGALDEKKGDIPYRLTLGPRARFRYYIYRERGIICQRVRLTEGLCPADGKDTTNTVQVIDTAYEGCPTAWFTVTDNYQLCMGRIYQNSCNFSTTSIGRDRAYIDPDKYEECGKCTQACPYNTTADLIRSCRRACLVDTITMDENGLVETDESKCIQCGACIHGCPFGAVGSKSFTVDVIDMIRAGKGVVAMVVPTTEGQFGAGIITAGRKTALKKTGFADMVEVNLDGDLTAAAEAAEWAEAYRDGKKMIVSCCPAFTNMTKQHFPMLLENMPTAVPPMRVVSRMLKEKDPGTVTAFTRPCIVKKGETLDLNIKDSTDYTLTYSEIRAAMKAKNANLEPEKNIYQESSVFGKRLGNDGGVMTAILECPKETGENVDIEVTKYNGAAKCKEALMLLRVGRLPEDFIEGTACESGYMGGPSKHKSEVGVRKGRDILVGQADDRDVHTNLKDLGVTGVAMHCR